MLRVYIYIERYFLYFTRLLYHSGQSQAFCSDYPGWSMQGVISYTFIFQDQYLVVANCTSCGVRISNEAKPQAKTQIFCWNLSSGWCLARTALVAVWWRVCFISKTWDSLYVLSRKCKLRMPCYVCLPPKASCRNGHFKHWTVRGEGWGCWTSYHCHVGITLGRCHVRASAAWALGSWQFPSPKATEGCGGDV